MGSPGPKRQVSDTRLLFEILISEDRSVLAAEIQSNVSLGTVQAVRDRLNKLATDTDCVEIKTVSSRNMYRLTRAGRKKVAEAVRDSLD
jgi:predicted transcriptional regulator